MKKLAITIFLLAFAITCEAVEPVESEVINNLAFGFCGNDSETMRAKFNDAILSMKLDGTISILQTKV